jgi:hypothetical protein
MWRTDDLRQQVAKPDARMNQTSRHILIDFENVPTTDLAPITGMPVEVSLLVGDKNKRLEIDLVEQLLNADSRVHLIRVGASGRNALDLTLAFYLGRAATENPRAEFFIISQDSDYDAMIAHVRRHGMRVSRHPSIAELPFLAPAKPAQAAQPPDRFAQFVAHLKAHEDNRPRRQTTLRSHIKTLFGNKLTDAEADAMVARLRAEKHIEISDKGAVTYLL